MLQQVFAEGHSWCHFLENSRTLELHHLEVYTTSMITMYTSPTCAYCHMAKAYLNSKGHKVKELDVSENPTAAKWVQEHIGQVVTPVLDINGTVVVGFDRPKIDLALRD